MVVIEIVAGLVSLDADISADKELLYWNTRMIIAAKEAKD